MTEVEVYAMTRAPLRHMKKTVEPEVIADSCFRSIIRRDVAPVEEIHVVHAVYAWSSCAAASVGPSLHSFLTLISSNDLCNPGA
jgi:hypothetical protein